MSTVLSVGNILIPVLLCVLIGYGLARMKVPYDNKMVGGLVANVGYPTLILSHLEGQHVELGAFLQMMLAAVAAILCFAAIGFVFLRLARLPARAFLSPMMLNNVGNVGLPVTSLAFGEKGLAFALAYVVVVMLGLFTVAIWIPMGRATFSDLVKKPVIYAVLIALVLMGTEARLPVMLDRCFSILGGLAIPLMLLTLGHTLATLKVGHLVRGAYLAAFHLVVAAAIAVALGHAFGFDETARKVFVLQTLMPVSVATYLWVEAYYPERASEVAGFILISTLLALVSLPTALILLG